MDLPVEFTKVMDESTPQRDGSFTRNKLYVFYLGKFGPFTERIPIEQAGDSSAITQRIEQLRMTLRTMPT